MSNGYEAVEAAMKKTSVCSDCAGTGKVIIEDWENSDVTPCPKCQTSPNCNKEKTDA